MQNWISRLGEFCTIPGALGFGTRNRKTGMPVPVSSRYSSTDGGSVGVPGKFRLAVVLLGKGTVARPARLLLDTGDGRRRPGPLPCFGVQSRPRSEAQGSTSERGRLPALGRCGVEILKGTLFAAGCGYIISLGLAREIGRRACPCRSLHDTRPPMEEA